MSFLPGRAACRRALLVAVDVLSDWERQVCSHLCQQASRHIVTPALSRCALISVSKQAITRSHLLCPGVYSSLSASKQTHRHTCLVQVCSHLCQQASRHIITPALSRCALISVSKQAITRSHLPCPGVYSSLPASNQNVTPWPRNSKHSTELNATRITVLQEDMLIGSIVFMPIGGPWILVLVLVSQV